LESTNTPAPPGFGGWRIFSKVPRIRRIGLMGIIRGKRSSGTKDLCILEVKGFLKYF
jgi:hypothetical protein